MIKVQTEQALMEVSRRTGIAVHVLRVSNPYGPGQRGGRKLGFVAAAIDAVLHGQTLRIWGDGKNTRDFVFIDDVGKAIALAVDSDLPSTILNIGSGRETSLLEVCQIVQRVSGRSISIEFEEGRAVDVSRNALDVSKARESLRWTPAVDLEQGIAFTI
jgi:UDP-glucose 4-epimerase